LPTWSIATIWIVRIPSMLSDALIYIHDSVYLVSEVVREKEEAQSKLATLERLYTEVMERQEAMKRLLS
jgi:hypothetical protein